MLQQFLKWTLIVTLFKRYKKQLLTIITALLALLLIANVHQDYLSYSSNINNEHIGWSFIVKWALYIAVIIASFFTVKFLNKTNQVQKTEGKLKQAFKKQKAESVQQTATQQSDPFANIRKKDKLKSKADQVIEQSSTKE